MKKTKLKMMWIGIAACLLCPSIMAEIRYAVTDLGTLGGSISNACFVNDMGQIVGYAGNAYDISRATLFDPSGNGINIDLGPSSPNNGSSFAMSINNTGQIVGSSYYSSYPHPTVFDPTGNGNNVDLGGMYPGGVGVANAVNNNGQVVGYYERQHRKAILYSAVENGSYITMSQMVSVAYSINDAGQVVGTDDGKATLFDTSGSGNNVYLCDAGSEARSINSKGQIVGRAFCWSEGGPHAAVFDSSGRGNNIDLGFGEAFFVNDYGQAVGYSIPTSSEHNATLFDLTGNGNHLNLNTVIDPQAGWHLEYANCINNNGWIVGQGFDHGQLHAFLLTPVPEPATLSLFAFGAVVLWRRRQSSCGVN